MAAGVGDDNGMIGAGPIETVPRWLAPELGFLITRAEDPLARRRSFGVALEGGSETLQRANLLRTAIHVGPARILRINRTGMNMRVDETGNDRLAWQVEDLCAHGDQVFDRLFRADCHELSPGDSERRGPRLLCIDG